MMLDFMKPFLFILILPVLKGTVQYIIYRRISGVLSLETAAFCLLIVIAVLRWLSYKITVTDGTITVQSGVFFKQKAVIRENIISSSILSQNLPEKVLFCTRYRLNTESGRKSAADFEIKLFTRDAAALQRILYKDIPQTKVTFFRRHIALSAALTSSSLAGILIGVPVINTAGKLLGISLSRLVYDEINVFSAKLGKILPPVVNAVTVILILSYLVAFAVSVFKNMRYSLRLGNTVAVKRGIIVKRRSFLKKDRINDVIIEQTPLMYMANRCAVSVSVAGFGGTKREKVTLIPCLKEKESIRLLKGTLDLTEPVGVRVKPVNDRITARRFMFLPMLYMALIIAVFGVLSFFVRSFIRLWILLAIICSVLTVYYAFVCHYDFSESYFVGEDRVFIKASRGLTIKKLYCDAEKIGEIKIMQTPADRRYNTCKIRFTVQSEGADSIKVRFLDKDKAIFYAEKILGISEDI